MHINAEHGDHGITWHGHGAHHHWHGGHRHGHRGHGGGHHHVAHGHGHVTDLAADVAVGIHCGVHVHIRHAWGDVPAARHRRGHRLLSLFYMLIPALEG